jgi:hypothetical protein
MQSNAIRLSHLKEVLKTLEGLLGKEGEVWIDIKDRNNVLFQNAIPGSCTYCYAYSRILEDSKKELV